MSSPRRHDSAWWTRFLNIGLLIGGFGIGQGSIFVVQTWMVMRGEFDLLAAFGTHNSFAILGVMLVDGGSLVILARNTAHLSAGHGDRDDLWRVFWETSAFRLALAVLIGIAGAAYVLALSTDPFTKPYLLAAFPGLVAWAFNGAGLLDGLRRSGISGLCGSLPYAVSAVALAGASDASPEVAGAILGGAFTAGYLVTVAAQWAVLCRLGWRPRLRQISRAGAVRSARDGLAMLGRILPGQVYFRAQLLLSASYLSAEPTALFIYAKQIVGALTQVIWFVLRVDFPGLVNRASGKRPLGFREIFEAQKTTLACALLFTIGVAIACLAAPFFPALKLAKAADVLIIFAPAILSISVLWMMSQALAAAGDYMSFARVMIAGAIVGAAVSCLLVGQIGIYAFVVGEIAFHAVSFVILVLSARAELHPSPSDDQHVMTEHEPSMNRLPPAPQPHVATASAGDRALTVFRIIGTLDPATGGPASVYSAASIAIAAAGARLECVALCCGGGDITRFPDYQRVTARNIPVHVFSSRLRAALFLVRARKRVDVLHLDGCWVVINIAAVLIARAAGLRVFITPHETLTARDMGQSKSWVRGLAKQALARFYQRLADGIVYSSHLERTNSMSHRNALVIAHPVHDDTSGATATAVRWGVAAPAQLRLGYLGRFHPKKRLADIVAAAVSTPDTTLLVAGGGSAEHELKVRDAAAPAPDRVVWLGFVHHAAREQFFRSIDFLVLASDYECFGMAAAEAMTRGIPVIVTEQVGVATEVRTGAEFITRIGCENLIKTFERCRRLRDDEYRELQRGALRAAASCYSFHAHGRAQLAAYHEVLRRRRLSPIEADGIRAFS